LFYDWGRLAWNDRGQRSKIDRQEGKQQSRRQLHRWDCITSGKNFPKERVESTDQANCVIYLSMLRRSAISLAIGAALITAPVYISARTCIVSDSPAQAACKPGCCANKSCCATSTKTTAPASQLFAKGSAGSEFNATPVATLSATGPPCASQDRQLPLSREYSRASPPQLAVLCTFLI
jgi:hypothetical protein